MTKVKFVFFFKIFHNFFFFSLASCGNFCDQFRYFTADRQRFGCGGYLNICGRGKCVKAKVIDAGPANVKMKQKINFLISKILF